MLVVNSVCFRFWGLSLVNHGESYLPQTDFAVCGKGEQLFSELERRSNIYTETISSSVPVKVVSITKRQPTVMYTIKSIGRLVWGWGDV